MLDGIVEKLAEKAQVVSVYNPQLKTYTYYMVPSGVRLRVPKPPDGPTAFGEALENTIPSLPSASFRIGRGPMARGRVVINRGRFTGMSLASLIAAGLDRLEEEGR